MPGLDQLKDFSPLLAVDLASEIWGQTEVFRRHGLTEAEGEQLLGSTWFQEMLREARAEWTSLRGSKQRVKLKGQIALEEAIPLIYELITDSAIPATARVAAFKELKDVSGVSIGVAEGGPAGSGLPSVTIYLGTPTEGPTVIVEGKKVAKEPETIEGLEILELGGPEVIEHEESED